MAITNPMHPFTSMFLNNFRWGEGGLISNLIAWIIVIFMVFIIIDLLKR